jgi:hypothetical protein
MPSLIPWRDFLLLDPVIDVEALETPLATNLESRDLPLLSHRVDGLVSHLQQLSHLRQCQDFVCHRFDASSVKNGRFFQPKPSKVIPLQVEAHARAWRRLDRAPVEATTTRDRATGQGYRGSQRKTEAIALMLLEAGRPNHGGSTTVAMTK